MELWSSICVLTILFLLYLFDANKAKPIGQKECEIQQRNQLFQEKPKPIGRNKWLHPNDYFGIMQNGVVGSVEYENKQIKTNN